MIDILDEKEQMMVLRCTNIRIHILVNKYNNDQARFT